MIVPMKKAVIMVQEKDADSAVVALRTLGIVHVKNQQPPAGADIARLKDDLRLVSTAINILSDPAYLELGAGREQAPTDWRFVARHALELTKRREQLEEYARVLTGRIAEWQEWGDFDPQAIEELKKENIYLGLYQIPAKEISRIPPGLIVKRIFLKAGFWHCAIIAQGRPEIPFKEIPLPKMGLEQMRTRLYEDKRTTQIIIDDLCRYVVHRQALLEIRRALEIELEFYEARQGMSKEEGIAYLAGFLPFDAAAKLETAAKRQNWGLLIRDPAEDEEVPVLLRNPKWVTMIRPVLRLLGILPGYRELDVSLLFLIFFSIFFGILIGDAGYGLAYLGLTYWLQKKKGKAVANKNIFFLGYLLSSCAIIWGALSGTFFGQEWLTTRNIKPLLPALNDPAAMQNICFLLGAIHLTVAHAWRACVKFPQQNFLADVGWIAVLWSGYFLARALILAEPFPGFGLPLALGAIALVLFFSEPRKNILKRLGAGFLSVTFGLSFMSAFTDVVSYVRLFAVGLAGVAIANTTNTIAAGLGPGIIAFLGGIFITVIGHALNLALGPIAVLVHGVRLNVLEFGVNHTNISWGGEAYRPLEEVAA